MRFDQETLKEAMAAAGISSDSGDETKAGKKKIAKKKVEEPPKDNEETSNGLPMTVKEMEKYLQDYYGRPIALRQEGSWNIACPYCKKHHVYEPGPGHYPSQCSDDFKDDGGGIVINNRTFIPNYGITIYEYRKEGGVNILIG